MLFYCGQVYTLLAVPGVIGNMRPLLFLFVFLPVVSVSQVVETVEKIDQLVRRIDAMKFTDTIVANDSMYDRLYDNEQEIIGFLHNDTLLKSVTRYNNSDRVRVAYHRAMKGYLNHVVCVREYDDISSRLLAEVYVGYDSFYTWRDTILKGYVFHQAQAKEYIRNLRNRADKRFAIEVRQLDDKGQKIEFVAEVAEDTWRNAPPCGDLAHAGYFKFKILASSDSALAGQYRYLIKSCFRDEARKIFTKGTRFRIWAATTSGATFSYNFTDVGVSRGKPLDPSDKSWKTRMLWIREFRQIKN